jgi:hypothetical protein
MGGQVGTVVDVGVVVVGPGLGTWEFARDTPNAWTVGTAHNEAVPKAMPRFNAVRRSISWVGDAAGFAPAWSCMGFEFQSPPELSASGLP